MISHPKTHELIFVALRVPKGVIDIKRKKKKKTKKKKKKRKSTRLNSIHRTNSYAAFCFKKKK